MECIELRLGFWAFEVRICVQIYEPIQKFKEFFYNVLYCSCLLDLSLKIKSREKKIIGSEKIMY